MMYYKIINDRTVFSNCKTIELDGHYISNPTAAQIEQAGWSVYVPPVVPPQPQTEPGLADVMEAVKKILSSETSQLSDEEALDIAALYPTWASKVGKSVNAGERLWWDGRLWKTTQYISELLANWTPDTAVSLFVEVSIEEWPEWVRPVSAETAYMMGDRVTFEGQHYESLIDNNTWSPLEYPAGWELIPQIA